MGGHQGHMHPYVCKVIRARKGIDVLPAHTVGASQPRGKGGGREAHAAHIMVLWTVNMQSQSHTNDLMAPQDRRAATGTLDTMVKVTVS